MTFDALTVLSSEDLSAFIACLCSPIETEAPPTHLHSGWSDNIPHRPTISCSPVLQNVRQTWRWSHDFTGPATPYPTTPTQSNDIVSPLSVAPYSDVILHHTELMFWYRAKVLTRNLITCRSWYAWLSVASRNSQPLCSSVLRWAVGVSVFWHVTWSSFSSIEWSNPILYHIL